MNGIKCNFGQQQGSCHHVRNKRLPESVLLTLRKRLCRKSQRSVVDRNSQDKCEMGRDMISLQNLFLCGVNAVTNLIHALPEAGELIIIAVMFCAIILFSGDK